MKNPIFTPYRWKADLPVRCMRGGDFTIPLLEDEWSDGQSKELEAMDIADRYSMEADVRAAFFGFRVIRTQERS